MKRLGFAGWLLLLALSAEGLWAQGTTLGVFSVTDSLTDNANGAVFYQVSQGDNWLKGSVFVVYEKSVDSTATALYWRNVTTWGPETKLLSKPHVHFRHPKILPHHSVQNSKKILFYETDESGNWDIDYVVFYSLDSLSGPFHLAHSELPETQLEGSGGAVVFQKAGAILFSRFSFENVNQWTKPVVLDSENCSNPSIRGENGDYWVVWTKQDSARSKLFYSTKRYNTAWEPPQLLLSEGEDFSPSFANGVYPDPLFCWKNVKNDQIRIYVRDFWDNDQLFYQFPVPNAIAYPSIFRYVIPTLRKGKSESEAYLCTFLLSYLKHTSSGDSIFWIDHGCSRDCVGLVSGDSLPKRNPKLYEGVFNDAVDVWERQINDHWQLRMAVRSYPKSDVNERGKSVPSAFRLFPNYPNPFNGGTVIRYSVQLKGFVELSVWNSEGQPVATLVSEKQRPGTYTVHWNGLSATRKPVASGLYFCRLRLGKQSRWQKMLFVK